MPDLQMRVSCMAAPLKYCSLTCILYRYIVYTVYTLWIYILYTYSAVYCILHCILYCIYILYCILYIYYMYCVYCARYCILYMHCTYCTVLYAVAGYHACHDKLHMQHAWRRSGARYPGGGVHSRPPRGPRRKYASPRARRRATSTQPFSGHASCRSIPSCPPPV